MVVVHSLMILYLHIRIRVHCSCYVYCYDYGCHGNLMGALVMIMGKIMVVVKET